MADQIVTNGFIHGRCPTDLRPLPPLPIRPPERIREAVERARAAQPAWEACGLEGRARLLKKAGKRLLERRHEAFDLISAEIGKTPAELILSETAGPLQYIGDWIRVARPWLRARKLPISPLAFPGKRGVIELLPRGVVGIISPWNYPLGNFFKPVFAALACGNAVVIKPSEYSPRTCLWFVEVMSEHLPPDALSCFPGGPEAGRELVLSGVDAVTFTGSYESGRQVAALAAERMIPCSLELGGKDAAIVLADCDLDRTVAGILHWSLHNAGQACGDLERVYVEEAIADRFLANLVACASALRAGGDAPDVGPLANLRQLEIVESHVEDARARGARVLCGGKRAGQGFYYEPTVLDLCSPAMKILREPTFGPVIPVMRAASAEEAVALANDCEYGLNASIWSRDERRATALARKLQVGTAYVNNHAFTGAIAAAPWTGVKKSGYGVANSAFALHHYTRPRSLVIDRKRSADAWWTPGGPVAEELGERLAEAQLGNIAAALKVPFLMLRRQSSILRFVRSRGRSEDRSRGPDRERETEPAPIRRPFGLRLQGAIATLGRKLIRPLSRRELEWGWAAMEAAFWEGEGETAAKAKKMGFERLSAGESKRILGEYFACLPFPANVTLKASLWIFGLAPILKGRSLRTLEKLPVRERVKVLASFDKSSSYLQRQLLILLKMNGAFCHASTTRFQELLKPPMRSRDEPVGEPAVPTPRPERLREQPRMEI